MSNERLVNQVEPPLAGKIVQIQMYAYERKYDWESNSTIDLFSQSDLSDEYKTLIGVVDIEFYVPPSYNRDTVKLFALRRTREEKIKQFNEVLKEMDETISKLESIGYSPSVDAQSNIAQVAEAIEIINDAAL